MNIYCEIVWNLQTGFRARVFVDQCFYANVYLDGQILFSSKVMSGTEFDVLEAVLLKVRQTFADAGLVLHVGG